MSSPEGERTTARSARWAAMTAVGVAGVVLCATAAVLGGTRQSAWPGLFAFGPPAESAAAPTAGGGDHPDGSGADGSVTGDVTVFDEDVPSVAQLDDDLLDAVRRAATDAAADGVAFTVNSGWRSAEYQDQLLREAVDEYGSAAEAARWVATPDTSPHVSGNAIDIGPWAATDWLAQHGARYGLCQIYANEPWHYELRPVAITDGCPAMYEDPTRDPRMNH